MIRRSGLGLGLMLVGLSALAACGGGLSEQADAAVRGEAEETIRALFETMNAHDTEGQLAFYPEGERLTRVGCTVVRLGYESLAMTVDAYNRGEPDVTFEPEIIRSQALSRDAAVITVKASVSTGAQIFWTFVLERDDDGRFHVAHEHESWSSCPEPAGSHPGMEEMMEAAEGG